MRDDATDAALTCPLCGYDLRGLPKHRCPECGHAFDPDELRRARHERRQWLFEHAPAGRRVRSFVATAACSLLSPWFWRRLNAGHAVEPARLKRWAAAWSAIVVASLLAIGVVATAAAMWRYSAARAAAGPPGAFVTRTNNGWRTPPAAQRVPRATGVAEAFDLAMQDRQLSLAGNLTLYALAWPLFALAALSIFGQTLGHAGMHAGHQWRVVLYALPTSVLPILLAALAVAVFAGRGDREAIVLLGSLASLVLTTAHLIFAHTRYLKLRHAAAQAILVQTVVVLTTAAMFSLFSN